MDPVTVVAYVIAIALPFFAVYLIWALDVFGTGKLSTILVCLGWGTLGAYSLAYLINTRVIALGLSYDLLTNLTAPFIEEILKALVLVVLVRHPRFRYIVDGTVYGFAVGIGFALSENLFIYLPRSDSAVLGTAISRTLSTTLMHAAASGMVGLALGRLRRSTDVRRTIWPVLGIGLAIALHVVYNNIVGRLGGTGLLLVAIGIGLGGSAIIAWQIGQGLADEKRRFAQTLGLDVGVSTGERRAVQQLGGAGIERIFGELGDFFGPERIDQIRRLLVLQANIGILQNNLGGPASPRLRKAWEDEIAAFRREIDAIRQNLDASVNLFMNSVFLGEDAAFQEAFNAEIARFDPTLVHTFDMFMRSAELAGTFSPEQLAAMAERLGKIEIFKNVSPANLENLSRAIDMQTFEPGFVVFREGDEGDAMYLIERGEVDITVQDRAGQDKLLRTFGPGDVVGEFSLLDGRPRSASMRARTQCAVLRLQRQVFMRFIQSRPQVVLAMLQYLADKVRYTTEAVETSINWLAQIEQGAYRVQVVAAPEPADGGAVALDPAELSPATAEQVDRAFSQAAAALYEREQALRHAGPPSGEVRAP
jgi:CRP-like cAMP-binding protein/RsiW-degrading membrane proteinase PrsW (M82 family)